MDHQLTSAQEPLLSSTHGFKSTCTNITSSALKWVVKVLMWLILSAWIAFLLSFPTEFGHRLFDDWQAAMGSTIFRLSGPVFVMFSAPVLLITCLSVAHLVVSGEQGLQHCKKNSSKRPGIRLWTFPVLTDGPFGVVSAAEFIGIVLVVVFVLWDLYFYTLENLSLTAPSYPIAPLIELTAFRVGMVGLFCLSFLFLPIARGSVLLRVIGIPFEEAVRYHVWLGHLTMVLFTLHGLMYVTLWIIQGKLYKILKWEADDIAILPGVITLLAGLLMWVTALPTVRKWNFELFYCTHHLYVVFILFLACHVGYFIFDTAAGSIFLFIIDRFLRFCQSRQPVDVVSARVLPCGTMELVLSKPAKPQDEPSKPYLKLTASVEGPYGHEVPYHLMYENLILVAGGIGMSPFLAILTDILYRINEEKPCLTKNILLVWAVKRSNELYILSTIHMDSICRCFSNKLNLEIRMYVTRETHPQEGVTNMATSSSLRIASKGCRMSVLVGTYTVWHGVYVMVSIVGCLVLVTLVYAFYFYPYTLSWWYKSLITIACMLASVFVFGGCVVGLWHLWGNKTSAMEGNMKDEIKAQKQQHDEDVENRNVHETNLESSTIIQYGARPDIKEILESTSNSWGHVDGGVVVCGPPTLRSSVAREIRSYTFRRKTHQSIFHFHSHSFDL